MNKVARGPAKSRRVLIIGLGVLGALVTPGAAIGQATPAPSNSADTIGPAQLRNFSLGGTPTTTAQPQPQVPPDLITPRRVPGRPVRTEPKRVSELQSAPASSRTVLTSPTPEPNITTAASLTRSAPPAPITAPDPSDANPTLPLANPMAARPTPPNEADIPRISSQPLGSAAPLRQAGEEEGDSTLPWIIPLLLAAVVVLGFFFRSRWRAQPVLAGGPISLPRELEPRSFPPTPVQAAPEPQVQPQPTPLIRAPVSGGITVKRPNAFASAQLEPTPTPARTGGIVASRLRPSLEIEFEPLHATIDAASASVDFNVLILNSGNAPARNVLIEACMVNAGPEQDVELRRFFDAPQGDGDRIAMIAPLARIVLKSRVSLPLDQVRAYDVNGRRLFVPLVAFNAFFEWASSKGQTSASFIVGRATSSSDGEGDSDSRMAPLRLDLGPRTFGGLEGRRHPLALRR